MKSHVYEKAMLSVGLAILVACGGALVWASVGRGIHLPGDEGRVDPANVYRVAPFNAPGVRQVGPNAYEAVFVAQAWAFLPAELRVPAGADVTFTGTSADILHGFNVEGTRLNFMLIPGRISQNSYRFREPGEYLIICHEYCGIGHHTMAAKVVVTPPAVAGAADSLAVAAAAPAPHAAHATHAAEDDR